MKSSITLSKSEQKKLEVSLNKIVQRVHGKSKYKMAMIARDIMIESQAEVPQDTGALHDSAYVDQVKDTPEGFSIKFGYGGPNTRYNMKTKALTTEYMQKVHEDLTAYHPHGKAKFLEDPIRRNLSLLRRELALAVSEGVKR